MGRTVPANRVLVERELDRIRRLARYLRDPADRERLTEMLEEVYRVLDAYRHVPMSDPLEPLIVLLLIECAKARSRDQGSRVPA